MSLKRKRNPIRAAKPTNEVQNEELRKVSSPTIVSQTCRNVKHNFAKKSLSIFDGRYCVMCGKNFFPTRPEYAWGDCCSYSCMLQKEREKERDRKGGKTRPVEQYTLDGVLLARFDSAKAAALHVGLTKDRYIRDCCTGKVKTSAGYVWRYKEESDDD